jgi:hypothetical protein
VGDPVLVVERSADRQIGEAVGIEIAPGESGFEPILDAWLAFHPARLLAPQLIPQREAGGAPVEHVDRTGAADRTGVRQVLHRHADREVGEAVAVEVGRSRLLSQRQAADRRDHRARDREYCGGEMVVQAPRQRA